MTIKYLYSKLFKKYLRGKSILRCNIHRTAVVASGCNIVDSTLGKYSYVGYDSLIVKSIVGSYCSLAEGIIIGGAEHPMDWVSTSPVFQNVRHSGPTKRFAKIDLPTVKTTTIGNDVWIGNRAIVKQGITIGDGAVIGAGAVVTKDVEPYSIVVGCPAKHIKYRFNKDVVEELLQIKWWELPDEKLSILGRYIQVPQEFIAQVKKLNLS